LKKIFVTILCEPVTMMGMEASAMNIPSKTQTGQVISAPEPQPLFTSNQKTEDQSRSHANLLISEDSAIRRLIVLVPNTGIDEVHIARQVWEFATPTKLSV